MTYEVSSGAVVFTRESGILRYVIVRSLEGFYGFPKGHIEGKESTSPSKASWTFIPVRPEMFFLSNGSSRRKIPPGCRHIGDIIRFSRQSRKHW